MRNFSEWLSRFRESISDYGYYVDFEKIHDNVDKIKFELNVLNYLIGSKSIEADFAELVHHPKSNYSLQTSPLVVY